MEKNLSRNYANLGLKIILG